MANSSSSSASTPRATGGVTAFTALVRKDLVLYFSNRRSLVMSIIAPIVIAAFFGSLFGSGGRTSPIPVAVVDLDHSAFSAKLVAALHAEKSLEVNDMDGTAAQAAVRAGDARAALTIPAGFGAAAPAAMVTGGAKPVIDVNYDPSQGVVLEMVRGLLSKHVMDVLGDTLMGGGDAAPNSSATGATPIAASASAVAAAAPSHGFSLPFDTHLTEATADRHPYNGYAHSFAGMGVQFILFMGVEVGIGLLLTRRLGLWKRLRAAPLSRGLLLGATITSGALTALALLFIIFAAAIAFFGVRIEGSIIGFIGIGIAFAILTASFGLLIAALGKTPEATRGLAIFATIVMVMLGGAWVPSFIFPQWLQTATLAVPTRWAVDGLDAMTWRGLGLQAALPAIGALLAFSLVFAAIAVWRFDWEEPRG